MTSTPESFPDSVVVFGASGFLGRNLVAHMRPHVRRIIPVSRSGVSIGGIPGVAMAELESVDPGAGTVAINVAAYRYDAGAFAASQTDILLRNVEIAGLVYEFCARKSIAEVRMASSIGVYPVTEADFDDARALDLNRSPHEGELMYSWSKRIAELYGVLFDRHAGIHSIAFRLTNPYGPEDSLDEDKAHVVPAFVIRALTSSGPFWVRGNPETSRDFIYVKDVCDVFLRSLSWRGRSAVYNLGSGANTTIGHLAQTIVKLTGSDREILTKGSAVSTVAHRRCRNERLRNDFGIPRFTALEEGLPPTIRWYRDALGK